MFTVLAQRGDGLRKFAEGGPMFFDDVHNMYWHYSTLLFVVVEHEASDRRKSPRQLLVGVERESVAVVGRHGAGEGGGEGRAARNR